MKKQIPIREAIGKTITGFASGGDGSMWLIAFEEEFVVVCIERGWEVCDDRLCDDEFDRREFRNDELLPLGVITEADLAEEEQKRVDQAKADQERKEQQERADYERLRAKFGPIMPEQRPTTDMLLRRSKELGGSGG